MVCVLMLLGAVGAWFLYRHLFGAPADGAQPQLFVISAVADEDRYIAAKLKDEGLIRSVWAFHVARGQLRRSIEPGGYDISKAMNVWDIVKTLTRAPSFQWVVIPEGLRKEEIANILARALGWNEEEKKTWVTQDTELESDEREGVYFPDTYLIGADEAPSAVAERLRANFRSKFEPFADEALVQNIRWVTIVKIASLLEREAAGSHDMPLIAGIIWNRLLQNMKLDIDATLQYARGDKGQGWWAPITPAEKRIDSSYNTYIHKGLPPTPIANPGLDALRAALRPMDTDCFYYLHDRLRIVHCAKTYDEHRDNIEKYLR